MSAKDISNFCLLCCKRSPKIGNEVERNKLKDQIFVIFLLRNVLEIPKSFCETLLTTEGNPSQWIFCCPTCSKAINDLHKVFLELTIIQKKYNLLKHKVKLILDYSKSSASCDENGLTNHQNRSAVEIRQFITSEGKKDGNSSQDPQNVMIHDDNKIVNLDANKLKQIKVEVVDNVQMDEIFYDFEEEDIDNDPVEAKTDFTVPKKNNAKSKHSELQKRRKTKLMSEDNNSSSEKINDGSSLGLKGRTKKKPPETKQRKNIEKGDKGKTINVENSKDIKNSDGDSDSELGSKDEIGFDSENEKEDKEEKQNGVISLSSSLKKSVKDSVVFFPCQDCGLSFNLLKELAAHIGEAHEKKYLCGHCLALFVTPWEVNEHYKAVHSEEQPQLAQKDTNCELCGILLTVENKKDHYQKCHRSFKCEVCKMAYNRLRDLVYHRRRKHYKELNLEPFGCEICKKTFTNPYSLNKHKIRKHTHDFPIFCPICKVGSINQKELDKHIQRVHKGERKFGCQFCEKKYYTKSEMEKHEVATHTKKFKFSCDICSKGFLSLTSLKSHRSTVHLNERPFPCQLCNEGFTTKSYLGYHQRGHHYKELNLEPYKCTECGQIFKSGPTALKKHLITEHTKDFKFKCSACGKGYTHQYLLDLHIRNQHRKESQCTCDVCGKNYFTKQSLISHVQRYHTKEFTHKCTLCPDKGYSDNWGLNRHMKMKHPELFQENSTY